MGRKLSFSGAVPDAKRDWETKTSAYTAVSGDALLLDSSGGAFTITLPASPLTTTLISLMAQVA